MATVKPLKISTTGVAREIEATDTAPLAFISEVAGLKDLTDVGDVATGAAKGDILVYNGTNYVKLAVGTNDQQLTADSVQTSGVKWAAAGGAGSEAGANTVLRHLTFW